VEPLAYGAIVSVLGVAAVSAMVGALIGAIVWRFRWGLALAGLGLAIWLIVGPPWAEVLWLPFARLITPGTLLTLLSSFVIGRALAFHAGWNPWWASLVALAAGLVVGFLYMLVFRSVFLDGLEKPAMITLAVDLCLAILAVRSRHGVARREASA